MKVIKEHHSLKLCAALQPIVDLMQSESIGAVPKLSRSLSVTAGPSKRIYKANFESADVPKEVSVKLRKDQVLNIILDNSEN